MKVKHIILTTSLCVAACLSTSACANKLKEIYSLKRPIHIAEIRRIYGNLHTGHGPFLSSRQKENGKEIWFWFLPKKGVDPEQFEISFISSASVNDPDSQTIIWPNEYVGLSLEKAYENVYKDYLKIR